MRLTMVSANHLWVGYKKKLKMDTESYIIILTALVGALGVKEIWKIIKGRVDHNSKVEEKQLDFTHDIITELKKDNEKLQKQLNEQHKMMIEHEKKITELVIINKQLRESMEACANKMEKMEERLMERAKSSASKKSKSKRSAQKTNT